MMNKQHDSLSLRFTFVENGRENHHYEIHCREVVVVHYDFEFARFPQIKFCMFF